MEVRSSVLWDVHHVADLWPNICCTTCTSARLAMGNDAAVYLKLMRMEAGNAQARGGFGRAAPAGTFGSVTQGLRLLDQT